MSTPAPVARSARLDYLRRARRERRERMVAAVGIDAFRWLVRLQVREHRARAQRIEIHLVIDTLIEKARKRMKARRSQALGSDAEFVVRARLQLKGLSLVERIHTPWRIKRGAGGKIVSATPEEKVSGDWRAVGAGGRSVLAECKYRAEGTRIVFSDLERHQVAALNAHAAAGGLTLLVWIHPLGVHIMQWPIDGFGRGGSLDVAQAAGLEWKP